MKIKTSKEDRTFQVINILIFAIFAIICAYPFYYLIINSILSLIHISEPTRH